MKWLLLVLLSTTAWAHEVGTRYQYWWLKGPAVKSWRSDVFATAQINSAHALLMEASHFERFREEDQVFKLGWRYKTANGYWELSHADGGHNKILAIRDSQITYGRALTTGLAAWINLKAQGYSTNDLHMGTIGVEKEWQGGWFLVPSFSGGKASYGTPADTSDVWGTQIRLGKYREDSWKTWIYAGLGEESQALAVLNQTRPLKVKTYGVGGELSWTQARLLLQLERSYYPSVNTRYESLLASLSWDWGTP